MVAQDLACDEWMLRWRLILSRVGRLGTSVDHAPSPLTRPRAPPTLASCLTSPSNSSLPYACAPLSALSSTQQFLLGRLAAPSYRHVRPSPPSTPRRSSS